MQSSSYYLLTTCSLPHAACHMLFKARYLPPAACYKLPTPLYLLPATDHLLTTYYLRPTGTCPLPTPYSPLPTTNYELLSMLSTARRLLRITYYAPTYYLPLATYQALCMPPTTD